MNERLVSTATGVQQVRAAEEQRIEAERVEAERVAAEAARAAQEAAAAEAARAAAAKKTTTSQAPAPAPATGGGGSTFYQNCDAVRAAGAAPILVGQPGYSKKLDRDGDGIGCE